MLRILHLGPEDIGTSWQRAEAFRDLGHSVKQIYSKKMHERLSSIARAYRYARRRSGWPSENCNENQVLCCVASEFQPDIVFIEKGLTIWPTTLNSLRNLIPEAVIVSYSPDDVMNPGNHSKYLLSSVASYDIHITTKDFNVKELKEIGARRVQLIGNAYSPHVHRPIIPTSDDFEKFGSDVTFVGGYEEERAQSLNYMAENGISIRVWGNNWHRCKKRHPLLKLEMKPAYGDDYARVVCTSKILLAFLRKINRDTQTTRTMELPAFGAFMLAEKSVDHCSLFEENIEAVYFSDNPELVAKTLFYLQNDDIRNTIAAAGRRRCLESGYSYESRMQDVINICCDIRSEKIQNRG